MLGYDTKTVVFFMTSAPRYGAGGIKTSGCLRASVCLWVWSLFSSRLCLVNEWRYFNETDQNQSLAALRDTADVEKVTGLKVKVIQRLP